jgi:hypothetical protein
VLARYSVDVAVGELAVAPLAPVAPSAVASGVVVTALDVVVVANCFAAAMLSTARISAALSPRRAACPARPAAPPLRCAGTVVDAATAALL